MHGDSSCDAGSGAARIALVTGAARRLGHSIALGLAADGWDVAIHYHRSSGDAEALAQEIRALGRRAVTLAADLADEAATAALVPRCVEALGAPTCLVNNASMFQYDVASSFSYAAFEAHMRTNTAAPLLLAREVHRALPAGARGVVINLLDQKLSNLNPDFLSYTLSKSALQAATMMLAQAFAPRLRVVGVAPGITLVSGDQSSAGFERAHRMTPLERSSTPADIADAVRYLAGAAAVTGTILTVDGGQHLLPLPRDVMFLSE